jgi:Icc-related predicted phosphoesterase
MSTLKLLLFSDLHCSREAAESLLRRSAGADILVGAGDFANQRHNIRVCIDILRNIDRPAVLVPGNNESTSELTQACQDWPSAHVLHGTSVTVGPLTFFGIGGGIPVTPFGAWSCDYTEEEAAEMLGTCPAGCVLVSHSPPKGAADLSGDGGSHGSTAVRDAVLRTKPVLVVCGHIHASAGQQNAIGPTPVINAGPDGIMWTCQV